MSSTIMKEFFDGNLADKVITTPKTKKHTDLTNTKPPSTSSYTRCGWTNNSNV